MDGRSLEEQPKVQVKAKGTSINRWVINQKFYNQPNQSNLMDLTNSLSLPLYLLGSFYLLLY